ncbi:MAG: hypothetical protein C0594_07330 [Marinilabiliales bacterium]|nr:MAG: hypothetical protein C0594_07330 [Marinilabiliales bacterium]
MFRKKTLIHLFLAMLVLVGSANWLWAQSNCASTLKKAENLYDEGQIEKIPEILENCLSYGFSKAQKIRAYELLIQTYLVDANTKNAEKYMMKLLKMEPEYTVNSEIMPAEYESLFDSFQTSAIFSIGVIGGMNRSNVYAYEQYGVHDVNSVKGDYEQKIGFQFGAFVNKSIIDNLEASVEFQIHQNAYHYLLSNTYSFATTEFDEKQTRFEIPVSLLYSYDFNRIKPYARIGIAPGLITSDQISAIRIYEDNSHPNITGTNINMMESRNKVSANLILGAGIRYKVNRGYFLLDIRYNLALMNQTNAEKRYYNDELLYKYYIVEDNIQFNALSFSLGYAYSFYKPKKKNK